MTPRRLAVLATALCLGLAACSSDSRVGDKRNLDFEEEDAGRVGGIKNSATPSPSRSPSARPTATRTTQPPAPPTTAAPRPTQTRTQPSAAYVVRIVGTGQGFDPFNFVVTKGTRVQVVNTDNAARTFTSDKAGEFDSGPIAPGKSWTYVATKPGFFNFHDETRPFAVGRMEVRG